MAKKRKATRRKKATPGSVGLSIEQVCATSDPRLRELTAHVADDGGAVVGSYSDPFGGTCVLLVALPIDRVEPTPYQRDPSDAHVKRLMTVIERSAVSSTRWCSFARTIATGHPTAITGFRR
jgi:ParB family chromosome partitioning protein